MSLLKDFTRFFFRGKKAKPQILMPIDENSIQKFNIETALIQKTATLEAQLARERAEKNKSLEEEKVKNVENELAKKLNEQVAHNKNKQYGNNFSLLEFHKKLFKFKKFRDNIDITSADQKAVFGKYKDIRFYDGGKIALIGMDNKIVSIGNRLSEVFYEPDSLGDQLKRGFIKVPYDEEGTYLPNLDKELVPKYYFDSENNEYAYASELQETFKDAILTREETIRELRDKLENTENAFVRMQRKNDSDEMALKVLKNKVKDDKAELTQAMELAMQYGSKIGDMNRTQAQLLQMNSINEQLVNKFQAIISEMQSKAEEMHVTTAFQKGLAEAKDLIEWSKQNVPEVIHQHITPEPVKKPMVNVGETLK